MRSIVNTVTGLLPFMPFLFFYSCMNGDKRVESLFGVPEQLHPRFDVLDERESAFGEGTSGLNAGCVENWLVYGWWCNFPVSSPFGKVFYRSVLEVRISSDGTLSETCSLGSLAVPVGYGASLVSDDGRELYFVGGTDGLLARREISRVRLMLRQGQDLRSLRMRFIWSAANECPGCVRQISGAYRSGRDELLYFRHVL